MPDSHPPSTPRQTWQPPTAEELQALLPQYEISDMLGRGGMGAVYKGRQIALDRPVAIKILSNLLEEADASFAERFKNEARAMGRIMHPGVVAVFDFGETPDGLLYIVMEFVEGTDVSRMLARQKQLPADHALAITAHVLDALSYAHARGIIHRDIKPANVMVGYDGVVKVADFGLAKMSQDGQTGLTQSGTAMGTLHYMAPESLMLGTSVDHRADIYAVGVMLYQMLTGRLPQGMFELPSTQVPGLDPRYDGIIARALRDDREMRYQSASEMRQALDAILTQPVPQVEAEATRAPAALPTTARPQPGAKQQPYLPPPSAKSAPAPASSTRRALVWVALLVLVVFGGLAWLVFAPPWTQKGADQSGPLSPLSGAPSVAEATEPAQRIPSGASQVRTTLAPSATPELNHNFTNTLGMKFVPVPGTEVLFCIHETRRQDYAAYANEVPGVDGAWKNQSRNGIPCGDKDDHPVVSVSWEDAVKFCEWLSKKEGKTYRLPTDEEWSIAVGLGRKEKRVKGITPESLNGKETTEFPWGDDYPPKTKDKAGNYADSAWLEKFPNDPGMKDYTDGFPTTAPVMSFKPNKLGLYDMGGNVWEWVEDWWNDAKTDRVLRGASFISRDRGPLLSSYRSHHAPGYRHYYNGFRCVMDMSSGASLTSTTVPVPPSIVKPLAPPPAVDPKDTHTNTLGMKFVPVPGTEVLFCIHETRYKDYAAYATEAREVGPEWKDQSAGDFTPSGSENLPVVRVSWDDALKFCRWLSKKEGKRYRLPTDREWSLAVGVGGEENWQEGMLPASVFKDQNKFPWGTQWPPPPGAGNYSDVSRNVSVPSGDSGQYLQNYNDGFPAMAPVMSFQANALGLYDMGGNVWEWVEDWHDHSRQNRVLRGGSWRAGKREHMLSSHRARGIPDAHDFNYGFRLVLARDDASGPVVPHVEATLSVSPAKATKEQPFTNTLGMKFVPVPGTKVLFCIHETRRQDYAAYAAEISGVSDAWKKQQRNGIPCGDKDDHPVCGISWEDAKAFCVWLSKKESASYRLPTDQEWSIAVGAAELEKRGSTTTPEELAAVELDHYQWGTEPVIWTEDKLGNYQDLVWKEISAKAPTVGKAYRDGFLTSAPVMNFRPNVFGLYDLGGNVWEWVEDVWNAEQQERVLRGASFLDYNPAKMRSSGRAHHPPGYRSPPFGFRVALVPAK